MRISLQFKSAHCLLLMGGWICIWYEGLALKIEAKTSVSPLVLELKNHSGRPSRLASILLSSFITCTVTWWVQWWQLKWRNGICFADHQHTAKSAHHQHTVNADATIVILNSDTIVRQINADAVQIHVEHQQHTAAVNHLQSSDHQHTNHCNCYQTTALTKQCWICRSDATVMTQVSNSLMTLIHQ